MEVGADSERAGLSQRLAEEAKRGGPGACSRIADMLGQGADANGGACQKGMQFGRTPLMEAASWGDEEMVSLLLAGGARVNDKESSGGWTALMWAANNGNAAAVKALLDAGANPDEGDSEGWTALMLAATDSRGDGGSEAVELLARVTKDVNRTDKMGRGALMSAAMYGSSNGVKALLAEGADPGIRMAEGETPLIAAAAYGHAEALRVLLEFGSAGGSGLETADKEGKTALLHAVEGGYEDCVAMLLKAGALAGARRADGLNSLEVAHGKRYGGVGQIEALLSEALLSEGVGAVGPSARRGRSAGGV